VSLDAGLARETYLDALGAAIFVGGSTAAAGCGEAAEAARAAPPAHQPPQATDLLIDGLATRFTEGYAASQPQAQASAARLCRDGDDSRWCGWRAASRRITVHLAASGPGTNCATGETAHKCAPRPRIRS
jgi:hypothetical protein